MKLCESALSKKVEGESVVIVSGLIIQRIQASSWNQAFVVSDEKATAFLSTATEHIM